jgi:Flp pilus assembly protein TadG
VRWITRGIHRDEEGVTVVIVALSLIALLGMVVLVVDVGGLLWKRRELVNGADAAALSAAQTCSVKSSTENPEAMADSAAMSNVSGLQSTAVTNIIAGGSTCRQARGYVTVQYQQQQKLFFAPVLGAGSTTGVTTQATAAWGPLGGGRAVPIVLESSQFQGPCDIPNIPQEEIPKECNFWYDNGRFAIGDANWGFLNLDQWGVDPGTNCNSSGGSAARGQYIKYDYTNDLELNDPGPTYVCSMTGHATDNWQDLTDRMNCSPDDANPLYANCPGNVLLMPVNDCTRQLAKDGTHVDCGAGTPDKYAIIGFTTLELDGVYKGNDPAAIGHPAVIGPTGSCPNNATLGPAGGGAYGQGGWSLDALAVSECSAPAAPNSITNVTVTKKVGNVTTTFNQCAAPPTTGCDYVYDDATHRIEWFSAATRAGADTYRISFNWKINDTPASPGYCGLHAPDPNAICLVTKWLGYTSENNQVGSGEDFGTQGFVLCDFTYNSCPKNVKP